jgi:hypothetical protein
VAKPRRDSDLPDRGDRGRPPSGARRRLLWCSLACWGDLAPRQPARTAALRTRLLEWLQYTGAQIPQPNPKYDPAREREQGAPTGPVTAK